MSGNKGDTNSSFYELISKEYSGAIPMASKDYILPDKSTTLDIAEADREDFNRMYKFKRSSTTGNGECSLYWLFNCGPSRYKNFTKSNSNGYCVVNARAASSAPDLKFPKVSNKEINATPDNNPGTFVEVKSFAPGAFEKTQETLTRYGRFTTFINMTNLLSAADNLVGETLINRDTTGLQNIDYKKLEQAAENFCELRSVISKNYLQRYKVFKKMVENMNKFDEYASEDKMLEPCKREKSGQNRPGGELIAMRLLGYLVLEAVGQKPGFGSFMCNVPDTGNIKQVEFLKISKDNFVHESVKEPGSVKITAGRILINFFKCFKK